MGKKARVWDGTAWQELASAQTDLTAYSTTAQMNTAITAGVGLVPILTQTIGTAVSSVVVSNAFSATYDNYKITISGGANTTNTNGILTFGATGGTAYKSVLNYSAYSNTPLAIGSGGTNNFPYAWTPQTDSLYANIEVNAPFLTKNTKVLSAWTSGTETGTFTGLLTNTTSLFGSRV